MGTFNVSKNDRGAGCSRREGWLWNHRLEVLVRSSRLEREIILIFRTLLWMPINKSHWRQVLLFTDSSLYTLWLANAVILTYRKPVHVNYLWAVQVTDI
jgi:hypothetical protein